MRAFLLIIAFVAGSFLPLFAQQITITGNVKDESGSPLCGVNVVVKDKMTGTTSDSHGNFQLEVKGSPPVTLIVSIIGFKSQEKEITSEISDFKIILVESITTLGEVQVVAPSRVQDKIMQSPVSIEKMSSLDIRNTASDDYYKILSTQKGVDMLTNSINFQVPNTRGFSRTNNFRFVQLLDGMDMQAPTLNYPYGCSGLPSSLDVDNIELLPGAASALYGPNAFNGIMLVTSKSPFKYQGLSANVKLGFNHLGGDPAMGDPSGSEPMYEIAFRYAKAFKNKFAFKINISWMQARDWTAHNYSDKNADLQGNLTVNPAYDGVNLYGDDGGLNLGLLRTSKDLINSLAAKTGLGTDIIAPYVAALPAVNVNRTGYPEYNLADYNSKDFKFNAGLNYRISDNIELSYLFSGGEITSVLTAAQRYSIKNAFNQIHRLEAKGSNWNLMGYASFENSGDSYVIDFTGYAINNAYLNNNLWFGTYAGIFAGGMIAANIAGTGSPVFNPDAVKAFLNTPGAVSNLHIQSRKTADAGRWEPGSPAFQRAFDSINGLIIPDGARFYDRTRFYHTEGQYDFRKEIRFLNLIIGASWRMYDLRSNGTIFPDSRENPIRINEYGAYAEASKKLLKDHLRLAFSLRFDKSENFDGLFSPRISGVYTFFKNHNIRLSYQTGFRNPTTMDQYMDMNVISARVIGGLQEFYDKYRIGEWTYTLESVNAFTQSVIGGTPNPALLVRYTTWEPLKPEHVKVIETGYRGMFFNRLMIDMYYYYNMYDDFITSVRVRQAQDAGGNPVDPLSDPTQAALYGLLNGNSTNTFQMASNDPQTIRSQGAAFGLDYIVYKGYRAQLNYAWNHLITKNLSEGYLNDYNTPEHMVNIGFGNREVFRNFGFNIAWRWQDVFTWNSSFVQNGRVPAFKTIDAQVSYTFRKIKTVLKLGGSDILNNRYITFYGGPTIGAIYYLSLTFDQLMN
jgi:iron complex outermembrane recepter protein